MQANLNQTSNPKTTNKATLTFQQSKHRKQPKTQAKQQTNQLTTTNTKTNNKIKNQNVINK